MKNKRVFADPTVDFAFKRIFGTEKYKAATIGLLNSIIEGVNIVDVEFRNTTCAPPTPSPSLTSTPRPSPRSADGITSTTARQR